MTRPTLLAVAVTLTLASGAFAGHCGDPWRPAPTPHPTPAPTVVNPIGWNPAPVAPARQWYFGMSLQITQTAYGRGLQVASVTPGSPAALAGLEIGDVLLSGGGVSFASAYSNEHGVQLLQSSVGGGAPAPTAVGTFVAPPSPSVQLTVVDRRTGQPVGVNVRPIGSGGGGPAPTAVGSWPAPAASAF